MEEILRQQEIGDYRITVSKDESPSCPCEYSGMVTCFLWEYPDCNELSSYCDTTELFGDDMECSHTLLESVQKLAKKYIVWPRLLNWMKLEMFHGWNLKYDVKGKKCVMTRAKSEMKAETIVSTSSLHEMYNTDGLLEQVVEKMNLEELVRAIDSGGEDIRIKKMSTGYGKEVVAFCTKSRYQELVLKDERDWMFGAAGWMADDMKVMQTWMDCDVLRYTVEKKVRYKKVYEDVQRAEEDTFDWEELESVGGCYMDSYELLSKVVDEYGLTEDLK